MSRKQENTSFICEHCHEEIAPLTNGSYRNHCPFCLHSKHVDIIPGDRASACGGIMKPVGLTYKSKKGWQILHECLSCHSQNTCKVAEDTIMPDNYKLIAKLQNTHVNL